ncbi:metallophosphoesterase family protein [Halomicrobium salinisoli]|uniref:metallophosphoesterase family protein n=1 Tax=Halomicrobium salinisoli TaxID=2878391 RepID=UPI001CF071BD|nr:metallophosphoesterase [Halomicrobium salinisoli]
MTELYDSLSVLYKSLPSGTDSEWREALKSVLYGGELLADEASCYGKQQNDRNRGKRKEYARRHGNGERVTEFSAIMVAEPRPEDKQYVPSGAVLPVAPESGEVLPVGVAGDEADRAIALLSEFPAEPEADRPGEGTDVLLDPERVRQVRKRVTGGEEMSILFVSDTHIGYENRAITGSGKTVSWIDEISSVDTIKRIVEIAIDRDVDAVIHTGDILDHEVDADTLDTVAIWFEVLSAAGIPMYCIVGSHDHTSYEPDHPESVNGIAWLKEQVKNGRLTELSTSPTPVAGGPVDAYGISAGSVGIDDVGKFQSREWKPSDIAFGAASPGPNILCLHDGLTPYRRSDADVELDQLLAQSRVSFDCVLIGDEHRPKNRDFENGYSFKAGDGTSVFYTGPAMRISEPYRNRDAFVTEISISDTGVTTTRHPV